MSNRLLLLALLAVLTPSCGGSPSTPDVPAIGAVSLAPSDTTLWIGQSLQLRLAVKDGHGAAVASPSVAWQSSNPSVAQVTSSGLVTGAGDGSVTISARAGTVTGSAVLTVRERPVGVQSVRIDVSSTRYEVTQFATFAATPLDADKQPLANRPVTWTSSDLDIVSILPTGYFAAVSPGTATVTATSDGKSAQMTITVVPFSGQIVPWPNEPTGSVMVTERSFNGSKEDGWGDYLPDFTTVQDSTAPKSGPAVGQMRFTQGFVAGSSPGTAERGLGNSATILYTSFWMKLSSNWYGQSSAVNKIMHYWIGNSNHVVAEAWGAANEPLRPFVVLQGIANMGGAANLSPNLVPSLRIRRGQWQRWEIVLKANSAGTPDGTADWWIDGVKVGSYQGLQFITGAGKWEIIQWSPTWGGVGTPNVPAEQFMWMDHIYISGRS